MLRITYRTFLFFILVWHRKPTVGIPRLTTYLVFYLSTSKLGFTIVFGMDYYIKIITFGHIIAPRTLAVLLLFLYYSYS
jgi:hypothetical protein